MGSSPSPEGPDVFLAPGKSVESIPGGTTITVPSAGGSSQPSLPGGQRAWQAELRPRAGLGRPGVASPFAVAGEAVTPLEGFAPGLPDHDLEAVRDIVGGASVVGLGEAAHASAGFLGLKIRIAEYLIEHDGFRAVTWESARVPARQLQQYIDTCEGDPGEAVKSLYAIWSDTQTRDFAVWLCHWNQAHPQEHVQVHGFDVQDPQADHAELESFLEQNAAVDASSLLSGLATCDAGGGTKDYASCKQGVAQLRSYLEAHQSELAQKATDPPLATAQIALRSFEAWQDEANLTGYPASFEARDVGMAEVFERLRALHFAGQKAMVWAHNIHVVKQHQNVKSSWVGGPIVTMGTRLERDLGAGSYRAFAMVGLEVSLNRNGYQGPVSPAPSAQSLESKLASLGLPALLVRLHHPAAADVVPRGVALEMGAPGVEVDEPALNYDGLLYLEESPYATLVP